jgi:hypothetical protein
MKCRFGQNGLARQDRPRDSLCYFKSPIAKLVSRPHKGYEKPRVRDDVHLREKPLREERSGGPITVPAYFIHGCSFSVQSLESVVSKASRTTRPTGSPVRRATCRRRSSNSLGRRIVSVLPIGNNCNTRGRPAKVRDQFCRLAHVTLHENPLRDETSRGPPLIMPANSSRGLLPSRDRKASKALRTTRPTGSPVRRDTCRS